METPILDTPVPGAAPRWQLTAPESYVLLNGPRAKGVEAFKMGLLELVARGVLTIEMRAERSFPGFTAQTGYLHPGPKWASVQVVARPLMRIGNLYAVSPCYAPPGVRIKDLAGSARDRDMPLKRYTRESVVPALMERGLYRQEDYRVLGLFPSTRFVETAKGAAARAELEGLMKTVARDFGASCERDPRQSLALVGMLGSAIVLMNPLFPDLGRLSQVLRNDMGTTSPSGGFELSVSNLDLNSFDFSVGALDSLGGAFDAIGDMGDGGGGDGGGGDGGGGGD